MILRCAAVWLLAVGSAGATDWVMDAADSRLEFVVSYTGIEVPGHFGTFTTELRFDSAQLAGARLRVVVQVTSADMQSADLNTAIATAEWFDFVGHAEAVFVSDRIVAAGPGRFVAAGMLNLKGIERAIEVPFIWRDEGERATMQGELMLQRGDFEIGTGEWVAPDIIGADVRVRFEVTWRAAE